MGRARLVASTASANKMMMSARSATLSRRACCHTASRAAVGVTWAQAFSLGLTPFLVGDLLKAAVAAGIFTIAWRAIDKRRSA